MNINGPNAFKRIASSVYDCVKKEKRDKLKADREARELETWKCMLEDMEIEFRSAILMFELKSIFEDDDLTRSMYYKFSDIENILKLIIRTCEDDGESIKSVKYDIDNFPEFENCMTEFPNMNSKNFIKLINQYTEGLKANTRQGSEMDFLIYLKDQLISLHAELLLLEDDESTSCKDHLCTSIEELDDLDSLIGWEAEYIKHPYGDDCRQRIVKNIIRQIKYTKYFINNRQAETKEGE